MDCLLLNADGNPKSLLPLSGLPWQDAIKHIWLGTAFSVHDYEDWIVRSPSVTYKVPAVLMLREHVRFRPMMLPKRENVFLRDDYVCQYCTKRFPSKELTLDHVLPKARGGRTRWDNLTTACARCNVQRGDNVTIRPLREPWKPSYGELVAKRRVYPIEVPHRSWADYLGWTSDVIMRFRHRPKIVEWPSSEF